MTVLLEEYIDITVASIENDGNKPKPTDRVYTNAVLLSRYYQIRPLACRELIPLNDAERIIDKWCREFLPSWVYEKLLKRKDKRTYIVFFDEIETETKNELKYVKAYCEYKTLITGLPHTYRATGCGPDGQPIFWKDEDQENVDFDIIVGSQIIPIDIKKNDKTDMKGTWKICELLMAAEKGATVVSILVNPSTGKLSFYEFSPDVASALCACSKDNQFYWYESNAVRKPALCILSRDMKKWKVAEAQTVSIEAPDQKEVNYITERGFYNKPAGTEPCT